MLKEAGRQELVTVQQLCGAVLEKNPDVEQDFILGLRQPTKSWQEKGEQILNQYGYDEEHLLADNTLYAAYMIAWRNWTGFFLITTFLLLATSLLYFYSIIRNSNREILLILEQYLSEDFPREELPFWIISIVKNEALLIIRKSQKTVSIENWDGYVIESENVLDYTELVNLFTKLPLSYRAVLEMKILHGYSDKEIATHLGISETAVSTRASRGRTLLREIVRKEGFSI